MKIPFFAIFALLAVSVTAQTNLVSTNLNRDLEGRYNVVVEAIDKYFQIKKDAVDDTETISLNNYEELEHTDSAAVSYDVVAFIHPPKRLPDRISLHLISHSEEWRFLEDHDFTIRFDDKKLSPGNLAYSNKVLRDATVIENIWPDFTLEQFHDIAFANSVFIKFGFRSYEIPTVQRQKWKLFWTYFNLKQASDISLMDFQTYKTYKLPPLTQEEIDAKTAEKAKTDTKAKAIEQKKFAAARALQANQEAAAKGDMFGLLRMGERYRDGDGVKTDLVKARDYLQKSADASSPTAKEELSKLQGQ